MTASTVSAQHIHKQAFLKYRICQLSSQIQLKNKKLKSLQQVVCCKNKKIVSLTAIVLQLKNKNLVTDNDSDVVLESFVKHKDLITNCSYKNLEKKVPKNIILILGNLLCLYTFFHLKLTNMLENSLTQFCPIHELYPKIELKP